LIKRIFRNRRERRPEILSPPPNPVKDNFILVIQPPNHIMPAHGHHLHFAVAIKSAAVFAVQTAVGARALARFNVDLPGHAEAA
jgi:hypothetical protein